MGPQVADEPADRAGRVGQPAAGGRHQALGNQLLQNKSIETLNLSGNLFKKINELRKLQKLPNLRVLGLRDEFSRASVFSLYAHLGVLVQMHLPQLQILDDQECEADQTEDFLATVRDSSCLLAVEEGMLLNCVESLIQSVRGVYHKLFSNFRRSLLLSWSPRDWQSTVKTGSVHEHRLTALKDAFYRISFEYKFLKSCLYSFLREQLFCLYIERISFGSIHFNLRSQLSLVERNFLLLKPANKKGSKEADPVRPGAKTRTETLGESFAVQPKSTGWTSKNVRFGAGDAPSRESLVASVVKIVDVFHSLQRRRFEQYLLTHQFDPKRTQCGRYSSLANSRSGCSWLVRTRAATTW